MVRKEGKIGGYGTPGFILLMVVVAGNMIGKAVWMALGFSGSHADKVTVIWWWALACLLPQFLLVRLPEIVCLKKKEIRKQSYLFSDPYYLAYQLWSQNHSAIP